MTTTLLLGRYENFYAYRFKSRHKCVPIAKENTSTNSSSNSSQQLETQEGWKFRKEADRLLEWLHLELNGVRIDTPLIITSTAIQVLHGDRRLCGMQFVLWQEPQMKKRKLEKLSEKIIV